MANISQTGLVVEASQDTTDNSKDSEQNLQLLKFRLIEPKKFRKLHANYKIVPLAKINHSRKERKENLAYLSDML